MTYFQYLIPFIKRLQTDLCPTHLHPRSSYRGSQKTARRRDGVDDKLDALREDVDGLLERWKEEKGGWERRAGEAEER